ncbi:MAG: UbiD family decarboxylase [Syntrophomonadaceae bacterium]|nr:UbiD family decarboxylase [Syntrophomonadaceae bacterium]
MFKNLRDFLSYLENAGDLQKIEEELSPRHEIQAVMKYMDKGDGPAVLFPNVKGYQIPVVGNLLGRRRRLAMAFGVEEDQIVDEYYRRRQQVYQPKLVADGPVKEVIIKSDIDITKVIPALTHHAKDIGPYFSTAVTIAKDPETGVRGMGLHRVQIKDRNTLGLFLATPPLSVFLKKAEELNRPLDIAMVIGMDPLTFFSSVIWAPPGLDKFDIAGALAQKPIELVKCSTVDIEVPAQAEFVLEGRVLPNVRDTEGPFGESSGYYFTYQNPVVKIQAMMHRKDPIYHALCLFSQEDSILMDVGWAVDNLRPLREKFPNIKRIEFKEMGQLGVVQIDKKAESEPKEIIEHLLSSIFIKQVMVVDCDVNIDDQNELNWALISRLRSPQNLIIKPDMMGSAIDPSAVMEESTAKGKLSDINSHIAKVTKIGIDVTKPLNELEKYEKVDISAEVKANIAPIINKYCPNVKIF